MKKVTNLFKLVFLSTMLVVCFALQANTPKEEKDCVMELKFMATSNLSNTPAEEGAVKIIKFESGDTKYEVNANSSRSVRKAVVRMLEDVFHADEINYVTYCYYVDYLGFRPKKQSQLK